MNCASGPQELLKGELTSSVYGPNGSYGYCYGSYGAVSYEDAKLQFDTQTNRWSATENSANNSWNVNFSSGNLNNNNKYNGMRVRPVVAYDTPTDFLNLVLMAFDDCCRHKRTSKACIDYCETANEDLPLLAHELYTGTYQIGLSTCFLVKYPKYREVFAASFRDRIVHHLVCMLLNPLFEQRFVEQGNVSFNCRKGFGTNAAQHAAFNAIKRVTHSYQRKAWVYRGDLVSFFMSIDKRLLWAKMEPFIVEKYNGKYKEHLLRLTKRIVFHCPEKCCVFNTPVSEWATHIEPHKSLFGSDEYHGMPIGNLTTQLFANFFLSFFDDFACRWFAERGSRSGYVRFVDDFVAVCDDKPMLKQFVKASADYLKEALSLDVHTDKFLFQQASHGLLFVGAYIKNNRYYLSNRTIARMTERVHGFVEMLRKKLKVASSDFVRMAQVLNSYLGFCLLKRTYQARRAMLLRFDSTFYRGAVIKGHFQTIQVRQCEKLRLVA